MIKFEFEVPTAVNQSFSWKEHIVSLILDKSSTDNSKTTLLFRLVADSWNLRYTAIKCHQFIPQHLALEIIRECAYDSGEQSNMAEPERTVHECARGVLVAESSSENRRRSRKLMDKLTAECICLVSVVQPYTLCLILPHIVTPLLGASLVSTQLSNSRLVGSSTDVIASYIILRLLHARPLGHLQLQVCATRRLNVSANEGARKRKLIKTFGQAFRKQRQVSTVMMQLLDGPFIQLQNTLNSEVSTWWQRSAGAAAAQQLPLNSLTKCRKMLLLRKTAAMAHVNAASREDKDQRMTNLIKELSCCVPLHIRLIYGSSKREILCNNPRRPPETGTCARSSANADKNANVADVVATTNPKEQRMKKNTVTIREQSVQQAVASHVPFWRAPVEGTRSHWRSVFGQLAVSELRTPAEEPPPAKISKRRSKVTANVRPDSEAEADNDTPTPADCEPPQANISEREKTKLAAEVHPDSEVTVQHNDTPTPADCEPPSAKINKQTKKEKGAVDSDRAPAQHGDKLKATEFTNKYRERVQQLLLDRQKHDKPAMITRVRAALKCEGMNLCDKSLRKSIILCDFVPIARGKYVPLMASETLLRRLARQEQEVLICERKQRKLIEKIILQLVAKRNEVRRSMLLRCCDQYNVWRSRKYEPFYINHILRSLGLRLNRKTKSWQLVENNRDSHLQSTNLACPESNAEVSCVRCEPGCAQNSNRAEVTTPQ